MLVLLPPVKRKGIIKRILCYGDQEMIVPTSQRAVEIEDCRSVELHLHDIDETGKRMVPLTLSYPDGEQFSDGIRVKADVVEAAPKTDFIHTSFEDDELVEDSFDVEDDDE